MSLADPILESHLAELGPAYQVFRRLDSPALRREAARLVDFLRGEQIAIPDQIGDAPDAIPCLRAAVQSAHPDRKCIAFVLAGFPGWAAAVAPESRDALFEALPGLAPAALDLGDAGMRRVVEIASIDPRALGPIAAYAMTTTEAVRAVVRIAHEAATRHRTELLERLAAVLPAEKMEESKDAERLPAAIADATAAAGDAWAAAMEIALELTERNASSAYAAMSALPGILRKVPSAAAYLADFREIVGSVGLQALGVCLGQLAGWHGKADGASVRRFVGLACEAGREYGVAAGMSFLERRTTSAKQMLQ